MANRERDREKWGEPLVGTSSVRNILAREKRNVEIRASPVGKDSEWMNREVKQTFL